MSIIKLIAEEAVTLTILKEPIIQKKTKQLFNKMNDKIRIRFDELIAYLKQEPINELSYEKILDHFDATFLQEILQLAVEKAVTDNTQYDIKENMLSLLTEENLINAVQGEPMIEAFKIAINSIPIEDAFDRVHRGALIFNLDTMNQEENPFAFNQNDIKNTIKEFDDNDIKTALKKDVPFDELLPGFRQSLAKDTEEEMAAEAVNSSEQKCTVKRDDERAKEFYEDWPDTLSPQWKDGKYLGCKFYANGKELKGMRQYLKDDIDD